VAETTVKRLLCGRFQRTGRAMSQVYQFWWKIYQEICFFQVQISHALYFISIFYLFTDSPSQDSSMLLGGRGTRMAFQLLSGDV
jgi:hypothetical protein